ncbi:hypothetical protein [Paracoccus sp. (in: a-proteobacteria)]|uniref:hypothetical protein n=1 Tax=Paracoccus sp. TaxID=267 RepID=UPI0035B2C279
MRVRVGLLCLLLAGCATQVPAPEPVTGGGAGLRGLDAQFQAERPTLRRVGYRNCDGYSMELLVPRQVARDPRGQGIWWQITPYPPARASSYQITVPEDFDMPGWRSQRRAGNGWQDLVRVPAAHRRDTPRHAVVSAADLYPSLPIRLGLADAIGVPADQLTPGSYRVQASDFVVETASGGRCSMRPFWVFDIQ